MAKTRTDGRPQRCVNCNAFLPVAAPNGTPRTCAYCGVAVDPPPPPLQLQPGTEQAEPPSKQDEQSWIPYLLLLAIIGGTVFWLQHREPAQEPSPPTVTAARPEPPRPAVPPAAPEPIGEPEHDQGHELPHEPKKARRHAPEGADPLHAEPCHISGIQMSAVVEANQTRARRCFDADLASFPAEVGLTSNWDVEVDGAGHVHSTHGRLHLLDFKRSPDDRERVPVSLPGAAALSCAEAAIRSWAFPAYSPKDEARMRMKCYFNFVIKDL